MVFEKRSQGRQQTRRMDCMISSTGMKVTKATRLGENRENGESFCHSIIYRARSDIPLDDLKLIFIGFEPPKIKSVFVLAWYRPSSETVDTFRKLDRILILLG